MIRLDNPIQNYAWGSRTALARLTGRSVPSAQPEAELWIGAHPSAPSRLRPQQPGPQTLGPHGLGPQAPGLQVLPDLIQRDPDAALGAPVLARFGPRLPFLLKILAADQALSLQVHPDAKQAREGFARESALGLPAEQRNYIDAEHKPELLVALSEFTALCGFRDPRASAALLADMNVPALAPVVAALSVGSVQQRLRGAMTTLLSWPAGERVSLIEAVRAASPLASSLAANHPDDMGVVVALLLNHVRLRPDSGVFLPAGHLHTYLQGEGVEIMAASDNVVRGGLTTKRVDVAELLRLLRFEVLDDPVLHPVELSPGVLSWSVPVTEFDLAKIMTEAAGGPVTVKTDGPRIVVCVQGEPQLRCGDQQLRLRRGESVFVAAAEPPIEVSGRHSVVFHAASP